MQYSNRDENSNSNRNSNRINNNSMNNFNTNNHPNKSTKREIEKFLSTITNKSKYIHNYITTFLIFLIEPTDVLNPSNNKSEYINSSLQSQRSQFKINSADTNTNTNIQSHKSNLIPNKNNLRHLIYNQISSNREVKNYDSSISD